MIGGASEEGGAGLRLITLTGDVAAWEEYPFNGPGKQVYAKHVIFVRDLRSGSLLHRLPPGPSTAPDKIGRGPVSGVVVKSDGAVAWMTTGSIVEGVETNVVHAVGRSGSWVVVSGLGIDPHSLRLKGSTLSWTQNGVMSSTSLR